MSLTLIRSRKVIPVEFHARAKSVSAASTRCGSMGNQRAPFSAAADSLNDVDAAALYRQLDTAAKERAQLQSQVSALLKQSQDLTRQVEAMSTLISGHSQNLIHIQAKNSAAQGAYERPVRKNFRPTQKETSDQPTHVSQIGNVPLYELAVQGNHSANKERLIREIMEVDNVTWEDAHIKLHEMDVFNEQRYWRQTLPYRIGIIGALVGGVAGTAMVFWRPAAEWYGVNVAGENLPDGVEQISSMSTNQVGTWTWSWMEPMIGTASFVILCSQFARAQMWRLNMRPYTEAMLRGRANRLAKEYPQYDTGIVRAWAKHMPMVNSLTMPMFRRFLGWRSL